MTRKGGAERIGVFLCHCGKNISEAIDLKALGRAAQGLGGVLRVKEASFLCSASGQALLRDEIEAHGLGRVVVAACSPLLHEKTFREACQDAGLNPFDLQIANIREQVAWVTPERALATRKAVSVLSAAVARVARHEPLEVTQVPVTPRVLVVGGGVAGLEAALRLAGVGAEVILVEREPSIGGHAAMLDRTFPTLDCSACVLVPKMAEVCDHPNVTVLSYSEVESVTGGVGNFRVRVRRKPRYVDESRCTGCGACVEACPVRDVPSAYDQGMGSHPAISLPFPEALPRVPRIDAAACDRLTGGDCDVCERTCGPDAIDFGQRERVEEHVVGAVIVATGYELFDPAVASPYGYGRWPNIVTTLQFERMCHPSGPTGGRIQLEDGRTPESVAVLHCIGSRDVRYSPRCSRVCCMTSLKTALTARERTKARVFSFYIDVRATGKDCEEFYERVQRSGVIFVRGKGTEVIQRGGKLLVKAEDTLLGRRVIVPVDMVVLAVGLVPPADTTRIGHLFGISCPKDGFFIEKHLKLAPVETVTDGVFLAGACQGPKDIPDSVAQGGAAAAAAMALIDRGVVDTIPTTAVVREELCGACALCLRDCPFRAIELVARGARTVATVDQLLCKSCGVCVATCPTGALTQRGYTTAQVGAELRGLLEGLRA